MWTLCVAGQGQALHYIDNTSYIVMLSAIVPGTVPRVRVHAISWWLLPL